jgi:hypothetical protein
MPAGLGIWTDPEGHDHAVVVVKGTFVADAHGEMKLASEPWPLVYADEHYGDPEKTSIRFECDFAPEKPLAEVIVVGKAVATGGAPVKQLSVRLEVEGRAKDAIVFGERRWAREVGGLLVTEPVPFVEIPLTFERAFGGMDDTLAPNAIDCEPRNLVGVGFHSARPAELIDGSPLPNVERPSQRVRRPRECVEPIGFGVLARCWQQRVVFAGTYDRHWLDEVCPFLPSDFDLRYFMSSATDQWFPFFKGGEVIRCVHMAERPIVSYTLPKVMLPVQFHFDDRIVERDAVCDTVILQPHRAEAAIVWRSRVPIGKRLVSLRGVKVGVQPRSREDDLLGHVGGKPHYRNLDAAIRWTGKAKASR